MTGSGSFVLREVNVLDEMGSFSGPVDVHVESGRVVGVGGGLRADNAPSFDFSELFLLPGIFDCHDHVSLSTFAFGELLQTPLSQWALEAAQNAQRTLEAGVTFVRDLCGADRGLRDAIDRGFAPGCRLQISVVMISQTGGHADFFLAGPGLEWSPIPEYPGRPPYLVDGRDEMRAAVRATLRAGADWIKLSTTGGIDEEALTPELTLEEIQTAVFEAARRGKYVAAHAYGGEGLSNAVEAGVRSIEHGVFLTEAQAAAMAEAGCFLVPTLAALRNNLRSAETGALTPRQSETILALGIEIGECVRIAKEYGVRLASGTDYDNREKHGKNLEELALMRQAGLTPEEALIVATAGGAELCGVADQYGRIAPGYEFDAIVLDEDPGDLSVFLEGGAVTGVFKGGVAAVSHPRLAQPVRAEALPG